MLLMGSGKSITDSMKAKNILEKLANGKYQFEEKRKKRALVYYNTKKSKVKGKPAGGKNEPKESLEESLEDSYKPKSEVTDKPKKPNYKAKHKRSIVKAKPRKSKKSKRVKKSKAARKAYNKSVFRKTF